MTCEAWAGLQVLFYNFKQEHHFGGAEQLIGFHIRGQEVSLDRPCSRVMVGTAPDNEGSRLVRTWFPCRKLRGSLQQFVEMVLRAGVGWKNSIAHDYHCFPASECETEQVGGEGVAFEHCSSNARGGMASMSQLLAAKGDLRAVSRGLGSKRNN